MYNTPPKKPFACVMASCTKGLLLKHGLIRPNTLIYSAILASWLLLQERLNGRSVVYKTSLLYCLLRSWASKRSLSSFNYLSLLSEELQKYMARRTKSTIQGKYYWSLRVSFHHCSVIRILICASLGEGGVERNGSGTSQVLHRYLWNIFVLFLKNHCYFMYMTDMLFHLSVIISRNRY